MISGVKRKTTAVESTYRFFQTIDLIISHLKRDADKKIIFALIHTNPTLRSLLIATAAVHLYHYMGIKVQESLESNKFTFDSTKELELKEKKILIEEVDSLLKTSFELEGSIFNNIIDLENSFLTLLIEERTSNLQQTQRVKKINDIETQIERELLNIISKFPSFYFYDFIGDLIGLNDITKREILAESAGLKATSIEMEKKLESEDKEDKYIEVSTLNRLIEKMQKQFEFKSYKELQVQTMPIRMIKKRILEHEFNKFPISVPGLRNYLEGNNLKKRIIGSIESAFKENINYEQFEEKILSELKFELLKQFKTNPNDFIYFLQSLYESSFEDIIFLINKRGIKDTLHLINVNYELVENVKKNMIRYNIKEQDLIALNDKNKNLINLAKKTLCNLKFPFLENIITKFGNFTEFSLIKILYRNDVELEELWTILEEKLNFSINDLREFVRKKQIIDKIFFQDLGLSNYSQIILLNDFDKILNNLVKDLFYFLLSKILRQLSRVIELYGMVSNDKALFTSALKRTGKTIDIEDWAQIKLEELSIERLIKRQKELVVVFNANNQVFLVNGFILSRLTNTSLEESIFELKNEDSYIYKEILHLKLKADLISPISYCIAYDLIKRFESFEKVEKEKVYIATEAEKKIEKDKKIEIRKIQEENTLNWIERKITSTLMGINRPGLNPRQGGCFNRFCEFYHFAAEKIKSHMVNMNLPNYDRIKSDISAIIDRILSERLGHAPNSVEIDKMLDGERYGIAKEITKKIGVLLDDAVYLKFKKKPKK